MVRRRNAPVGGISAGNCCASHPAAATPQPRPNRQGNAASTLKTIGFSDTGVIALVVVEAALPCLWARFAEVAAAGWLAQQLPR